MAIDIKPSTWIASYAYSSSTLQFPLASLSGLVAGDCDPTTGNFEKILQAILVTAQAKQDGFAAADKPLKMTLSSSNTLTSLSTNVNFVGTTGAFTIGSE